MMNSPKDYEKINLKPYNGPPYSYSVTINGSKKIMSGFDEQHIHDQIHPRKATKVIRLEDK